MPGRLTAISKGVCACVRPASTRILLEWPVTFSRGVSVLECAFLAAVFDVCMCRGEGGCRFLTPNGKNNCFLRYCAGSCLFVLLAARKKWTEIARVRCRVR